MSKVIIMIASPLTVRWLNSFCMDDLVKVFDLEYWNLAGLATPTYEACEKDVIFRSYAKRICTLHDLRCSLNSLPKDTVVLSHIHLNEHNYNLHRRIASIQKNRVFVDFWGDYKPSEKDAGFAMRPAMLQVQTKPSVFKSFKNRYYRDNFTLTSFVNRIRFHDESRFEAWRKQELYRLSCNLYNHYTISTSQGSRFKINLPDYETYLSVEKSQQPSLVEGRYILWIDSFFPYHPIFSSMNPNVDFGGIAAKYYNVLNELFKRVEKLYNIEVVVAAHPVSKFDNNPFAGRKVFVNKTALLVKHCTAVMMHCSHSVIWEILWDKPTCFLINQYVNYSDLLKKDTETMAESLNMPLYDMETITSSELETMFAPFDAQVTKTTRDRLCFSHGKNNAELLCEYITTIHESLLGSL